MKSADAAHSKEQRGSVDSLVSPPGVHPGPGSNAPGVSEARSQSPADHGFLGRRCSLIKEESVEEKDEEDMEHEDSDSKYCGVKYSKSTEESLSDDSDSRSYSSEHNESPSHLAPPKPRRNAPVRPLHSVRSSPQLLNQIFEEEGESDDDGIIVPKKMSSPQRTLPHRSTVASPEVLRKYEKHHRKRLTPSQRGTSYSSSDTSDTDETDPNRRRKDKLKHRFHRRDSSDHSSDTDGPSGPSGYGGGSRSLGSGSGSSRPPGGDKDDKNNKGSRKQRDNKSGGSSRQNGSAGQSRHESAESEGTVLDQGLGVCSMGRKISNLSIASSNLSNLSLTSINSRGSKYVIPDDSAEMDTTGDQSPKPGDPADPTDVDALNEENKARSRIIHVRSKDFTDLMDKFSSKDDSLAFAKKEMGVKFRRRPKDKMKMDINRNGLIARADCTLSEDEAKDQEQQQNVVKTKCCSVV